MHCLKINKMPKNTFSKADDKNIMIKRITVTRHNQKITLYFKELWIIQFISNAEICAHNYNLKAVYYNYVTYMCLNYISNKFYGTDSINTSLDNFTDVAF